MYQCGWVRLGQTSMHWDSQWAARSNVVMRLLCEPGVVHLSWWELWVVQHGPKDEQRPNHMAVLLMLRLVSLEAQDCRQTSVGQVWGS